jgi:hypothetical protein
MLKDPGLGGYCNGRLVDVAGQLGNLGSNNDINAVDKSHLLPNLLKRIGPNVLLQVNNCLSKYII